MPLQNRVTPFGDIIFTEARGTLMGNRGCLHDDNRTLKNSRWKTKSWITCTLDYQGIRRTLMQPNSYTELFFLDEATALAAGHRPCGDCRKTALQRFKECWAKGNTSEDWHISTKDIDALLHADRLDNHKHKRTYQDRLGNLPDGCVVSIGDQAYIKMDAFLYPWSPHGYGAGIAVRPDDIVTILTPRSIVNTLQAGYLPQIHPSLMAPPHTATSLNSRVT